MPVQPLYTAEAVAAGGRDGHVRSSDGLLDVDVRLPRELGGKGGATNPEQLFAAGYAACFDSALNHVIRDQKAPVESTQVESEIGIGPNGKGSFGLSAKLVVTVKGVSQEQAEMLVAKAHTVCPYSNAIAGNVEIDLSTKTK